MAKGGEFVLSIGDDNVVLTRFVDGKVANAWLGSPDSAMAQEELGEALAEDPRGRVSVLIDTLDQSFKEEEIPRVGIFDRRRVLARHINMAFPGQSLRGARLIDQTSKKTLVYEMASVPLEGRIVGWLDFINSLPNEKGGIYTIATESVDLIRELAPKDIAEEAAPAADGAAPEKKNHWRHFIGINVTGGLRQIIEKNGRLSLTRVTQAPPDDTPPADFADMIVRDFKATITYIRRLGYQVGEPLDVVVLTSAENKAVLEDLTWDGARSVSVYTPYEAGALLNLGSLGRPDQAHSDVLHAAWFVAKRKPTLPLSRSAAMGDTADDIREVAYFAAPYAAGLLVAAFLGWSGWTGYELNEASKQNDALSMQLDRLRASLSTEEKALASAPHLASPMRNVIEVADRLDAKKVSLTPELHRIVSALDGDAVVLSLSFDNIASKAAQGAAARGAPASTAAYALAVDLRLADVVASADEAVQTSRSIEQRLRTAFGSGYTIAVTKEPVGAQAAEELSGGLAAAETSTFSARERFYAGYRIEKVVGK
ncbi:MAG: hypothetical protein AB7H70_01215 [Rhodospirillaceae bacterium]